MLGAPPTPRTLGPAFPLEPTSGFDLPTNAVRAWAVQTVRTAIDLAENGMIMDLADLSMYMMRDSAFSAAVNRRIQDLLRTPFRIEPYSEGRKDRAIADAVRRFWPSMAKEVELRLWLKSWHLLDFAPASVDWSTIIDERGRAWEVPSLRYRNPRYFYWDPNATCWVDINYEGLYQVDVECGRYVLASTWRYGVFPGRASEVGEDWIAKTFALRDFAQWRDCYSWSVIKGIVPSGGSDTNEYKQQWAQNLSQNVRNRVVMVPRSPTGEGTYDVEVLKLADPEGYAAFMQQVEYTDRKFQITLLGGNVSSEVVNQSSKATADSQMSTEVRLIQADNAVLSQVLRDQLVRFFVTQNFGFDAECPFVYWDVALEEENSQMAKGLLDFTKALNQLPQGYVIDNVAELGERFGVKIRREGQIAPPPAKMTPDGPNQNSVGGGEEPNPAPGLTNPGSPGDDDAEPEERTVVRVGNKWRVKSHSGKNLGTFNTKAEAVKHLGDVEYFKSHPGK